MHREVFATEGKEEDGTKLRALGNEDADRRQAQFELSMMLLAHCHNPSIPALAGFGP